MKRLHFLVLLVSIFFIVLSLIIRIRFAVTQAIFVDEFPNVQEAVSFSKDLFSYHPNINALSFDIIKPVGYRLFFGIGIMFFSFIHDLINRSFISIFPNSLSQSVLYARFTVIILNILCYLFILLKSFKRTPLLSFFFILVVSLNPLLLFNSSIAETPAIIIPLSLVFIYVSADLNVINIRSYFFLPLLIGLMLSTQYYAFIFIVYALIIIVLKNFNLKKIKAKSLNLPQLALRISVFLIIIPLAIFLLVNPTYWHNPLSTILSTLKGIAYPLSSSSGVYEVGVFFAGRSFSTYPFYSIILEFFLGIPVLEIILFMLAIFYLLRMFIKKRNKGFAESLAMVSLLILFGNFIFAVYSPHFRAIGTLATLILPPASFVVAYGASRIVSSLATVTFGDRPTSKIFKHLKYIFRKNFRRKISILGPLLALVCSLIITVPIVVDSTPNFQYANPIGTYIYGSGANMVGAFGSEQANMLMAEYLNSHGIRNETVVSLAQTSDLSYYANSDNFIQLWPTSNPVNSTELYSSYFDDYLVLDQWYSQVYGNPISQGSLNFPIVHEVHVDGGYSILYHIGKFNNPTLSFNSNVTWPIYYSNWTFNQFNDTFLPLNLSTQSENSISVNLSDILSPALLQNDQIPGIGSWANTSVWGVGDNGPGSVANLSVIEVNGYKAVRLIFNTTSAGPMWAGVSLLMPTSDLPSTNLSRDYITASYTFSGPKTKGAVMVPSVANLSFGGESVGANAPYEMFQNNQNCIVPGQSGYYTLPLSAFEGPSFNSSESRYVLVWFAPHFVSQPSFEYNLTVTGFAVTQEPIYLGPSHTKMWYGFSGKAFLTKFSMLNGVVKNYGYTETMTENLLNRSNFEVNILNGSTYFSQEDAYATLSISEVHSLLYSNLSVDLSINVPSLQVEIFVINGVSNASIIVPYNNSLVVFRTLLNRSNLKSLSFNLVVNFTKSQWKSIVS